MTTTNPSTTPAIGSAAERMSGALKAVLHCAHARAAGRYGDEATLLARRGSGTSDAVVVSILVTVSSSREPGHLYPLGAPQSLPPN